ncbi:MAG: class I SAM-dependent methyltransferase [Myxococcota bacterium]
MDRSTHYLTFATAYARGALALPRAMPDESVLARAKEAELRLHRFKRNAALPRVRRVLGILRALNPTSLVDLGPGRGTFLWPCLDAFPSLHVLCVEQSEVRCEQLEALRAGGVDRVNVLRHDITTPTSLSDGAADVVTALEVLEHVSDPRPAARELVRLATRFVVVSVPSTPDDNPEHLRLFTPWSLEALLREAGATRVQIDHVPRHMIAVARVGAS